MIRRKRSKTWVADLDQDKVLEYLEEMVVFYTAQHNKVPTQMRFGRDVAEMVGVDRLQKWADGHGIQIEVHR